MTRGEIEEYLKKYDFDVRKSRDARFVDQKCTPDIVCFVADCVLNMVATKPTFAISDIWDTQFFVENSRAIFGKPWANDKKAHNEYNKVLSHPLKLLAYAHILRCKKERRVLIFSVENYDLLDYISRKDRNAYVFLYCYFHKVLEDSGFIRRMEEYRLDCTKNLKEARAKLYRQYRMLIAGNTPSHSPFDIDRIFHKILNVYAVENNIPGSRGKNAALYSDLMYNKKNWRDFGKAKGITRREAAETDAAETRDAISNYYIQKAVATLRKIQTESEVHDKFSQGAATQVHHIFPRSQFPEIAHYLENLILLTATQHNAFAHPKNNTQIINRDYQLVCLLSKADTIQKSLASVGEQYYRKESFVYVINHGLAISLPIGLSFAEIKAELIKAYDAQ